MKAKLYNFKCPKNKNIIWNLFESYESLDDFLLARNPDIYNKLLQKNYFENYSNMLINSSIEIENKEKNNTNNKDNFIIMKYNEYNHIVNICKSDDKIPDTLELKRSNIYLISIEYKNPKMNYPVLLTIPNSYYTINNELFSAGFILRCLQYQNSHFYFDDEYELFLMGSNIQMDTLKYGQYIKMKEDEYVVMNM
jgi:hypothetical protein